MKEIKIDLLVKKSWCFFCSIGIRNAPHFENHNLTLESPHISTRRPQTPDEGIGTLCRKCRTQKVFDGSHLSGKIEGSQARVSSYDEFRFRNMTVFHMLFDIFFPCGLNDLKIWKITKLVHLKTSQEKNIYMTHDMWNVTFIWIILFKKKIIYI